MVKIKHGFTVLICLFLLQSTLFATVIEDKRKLATAANRVDSISILHDICQYYNEVSVRTDSILKYALIVMPLTERQGDPSLHARSLLYSGAGHLKKDSTIFFEHLNNAISPLKNAHDIHHLVMVYDVLHWFERSRTRYDNSRLLIHQCIETIQAMPSFDEGKHAYLLARMYSSVGSSYVRQARFLDALKAGLEAEKWSIIAKDSARILRNYMVMSTVYGELSSEDRKFGTKEDRALYRPLSLDYMEKAFELAKSLDHSYIKASSALNLSIFHSMTPNYAQADSFIQIAIDTARRYNHSSVYLEANRMRSEFFQEQGQLGEAQIYLDTALHYARKMGEKIYLSRAEIQQADLYMDKNELSKAKPLILKFLPEAASFSNLTLSKNVYQIYSDIMTSERNYEQALVAHKQYIAAKDSMIQKENFGEIASLKEEHESEIQTYKINELEQKNEIQQLLIKRKNYWLWMALLVGLLITGGIYFIFKKRTFDARQDAIDIKQRLLRSQLNPHFLFNALNAIQQFIYQQKEPKEIANHLAKFSRLTRRILQYSQDDYIKLSDEINFLKDYLDLQQIRFDEPFSYQIELDENISEESILIPPMFTQPFLENSIEHGILNKQEKGNIHIAISKEEDSLVIKLEDNGVGREQAAFKKRNESHRSMATRITRDRLKSIEQKLRKKAHLYIQDIMNTENVITGTRVTLTLPLQYG